MDAAAETAPDPVRSNDVTHTKILKDLVDLRHAQSLDEAAEHADPIGPISFAGLVRVVTDPGKQQIILVADVRTPVDVVRYIYAGPQDLSAMLAVTLRAEMIEPKLWETVCHRSSLAARIAA